MTYNQAKDIAHRLEVTLLKNLPYYQVQWLPEIGSTNTQLLHWVKQGSAFHTPMILGAQYQTVGRGRLNRQWVNPNSDYGLTFSCAFPIHCALDHLASVTPLLGLKTAQCLRNKLPAHIQSKLCVKWPNDLMFEDAKLCGLLVEVAKPVHRTNAHEHILVIGLGMNLQKAQLLSEQLGRPVSDWTSILSLSEPKQEDIFNIKADLVIALVKVWEHALKVFEAQGFSPFLDQYTAFDYLKERYVDVFLNHQLIAHGEVLGLDALGRLVLNTPQGQKAYCMGDVSVKESE